ncbi:MULTISPECIES: TetR/AcrR family transcriptional regulator [Sphingobium]|uniref:TetR/AcrR family transcriptional regulator n=1 Tax=Sphingobium sp. MI1205 TaxID=407020 RepID=UPI0007703E0B|nr:TetR-like C-terminal domain-containing protein [Sphingobium sp. MI1205]AMK20292.1 TetR-family transcriptional regulator [Sphingobium sp. MI1205]
MTAGDGRHPRWQGGEAFASSQAIFRNAAHAMIRAGSLSTLSMRGLAAAVGASAMTAYRYYPDKHALIADVREEVWRQFAACLDRATAGISGAEDRFRRACDAYVRFALDREHEFRLLFETDKQETAARPEGSSDAASWTLLTGLVRQLMPDADRDEVLEQAHWIWASLHGMTMLHLSGRLMLGRSLDQLAAKVIEAHLQALRQSAGRRASPVAPLP